VELASLTSSLTKLVGDHGLYAVFGLMALDAVFPAASELVMLYAGAVAAGVFASHVSLFGSRISSGFDSYLAMALAGTIGYLLGAIGGWAIGYWGDQRLHVSERKLAKARRWFDRWDDWAVFLGRITPVARSFISIPAGVFEMPFWPYLWLTAIGSAIWCFAFAGAGWGLGRSWERFHHDFRFVDYLFVLAVVAVAVWLLLRWRASRRARLAAE
jgi:membrane protein DedA with SNARE-associated domain